MEWFPKRRFGDVAADAARRWPDREALVFGDRRWTHAEVSAEVDRVAKGLMAAGVRAGPADLLGTLIAAAIFDIVLIAPVLGTSPLEPMTVALALVAAMIAGTVARRLRRPKPNC